VRPLTLAELATHAPGLALIASRRSEPRLGPPAPSPEELALAVELAGTAPDHRELTPYRMVAIWPDAARALVARIASERAEDAERARVGLSRAPLFVVVVASLDPTARTSLAEQRDAAAVATGYLLLALAGLGYGSMWRTGRLARDPSLGELVGLAPEEQVIALVGVGTSLGLPADPRARHPRLEHRGSPNSQESLGMA